MTGGPVDVVIETGISAPYGQSRWRRAAKRSLRRRCSRASRAASAKPSTNEALPHVLASVRAYVVLLLAAASGMAIAVRLRAVAAQPQAPQPHCAGQQPARHGQHRRRAPALHAAPEVPPALARLTGAIEAAEKALQQLTELEEELGRLRIEVEDDPVRFLRHRRDAASAARGSHARRSRSSGRRRPRTGLPKLPTIAAERARLTALASALDGAIKSTELTWVRARQLIEQITVLRHSLFTRNLMERLPSPLLPGIWRDVIERLAGRRPPAQLPVGRLAAVGSRQEPLSSPCCSLPLLFSTSC